MSIDKLFYIGFGFFFGISIIQQIYFGYKIRKISQQTGQKQSKSAETRLTPKASFRYGLFLTLFYMYIIIWSLYNVWTEKFSVILGSVFIVVGLLFIRKPIKLVRDNRPVHAELSFDLPYLPRVRSRVTPELITEILKDERVISIIINELKKTCQIGYKEQWRLGLLTPDIDTYDLSYNFLPRKERLSKSTDPVTRRNIANQIPIKRSAIINATTYFTVQADRIMILNGTVKPMIQQYPGWSYKLIGGIPGRDYRNIRALEIDTDWPSTRNRSQFLPKFLQEDGFPLKEHYLDGDPLTTERGGTIIVDKEVVKVIYPNYYIQRRIIDDEGNLVYLGLDENFGYSSTWNGVSVVPSVSKKLYKCVTYNEYIPIVRFRSFPYTSNFMLPILDTPMSESGWADLFIDPQGKAKLYIAKDKSLNEWFEMMERLRQLFFEELGKKGYHLLGLTKDQMHLYEYFSKKQKILEDYFIVQDWSLLQAVQP
jgi:predicted DNA-binding protein YlxM (UPF0122 family)